MISCIQSFTKCPVNRQCLFCHCIGRSMELCRQRLVKMLFGNEDPVRLGFYRRKNIYFQLTDGERTWM